jgi:hypothetical protein
VASTEGTTWLAADRGGWLQHCWNHLVRYNVGRRRERLPWSANSTMTASCEGKQRDEFGLQQGFGVVSELWGWGIHAHFLDSIFGMGPEWELWRECVPPVHEVESNGRCGEAPACCELFRTSVSTSSGSLALMQCYYNEGSCIAVASRCDCFFPHLVSFAAMGSLKAQARCLQVCVRVLRKRHLLCSFSV